MVVSGSKLGPLGAVGLLLLVTLPIACTAAPSTGNTTATLQASTSSVSTTSVSTTFPYTTSTSAAAAAGGVARRVTTRVPSDEPRLGFHWQFLGSGSFPTDTAKTVTLQLGFSPSGSLLSLFIVACAPDTGQLLTATSSGPLGSFSLFGNYAEYIDIAVVVVDGVSMDVKSRMVVSYLEAVELVGQDAILAQLPAPPAPRFGDPGHYLLEAYLGAGGEEDIPGYARALVWEGSAFGPLDAGDPRRHEQSGYVRLVATPTSAANPTPAPLSREQWPTISGSSGDIWPVFFVIPIGSPA